MALYFLPTGSWWPQPYNHSWIDTDWPQQEEAGTQTKLLKWMHTQLLAEGKMPICGETHICQNIFLAFILPGQVSFTNDQWLSSWLFTVRSPHAKCQSGDTALLPVIPGLAVVNMQLRLCVSWQQSFKQIVSAASKTSPHRTDKWLYKNLHRHTPDYAKYFQHKHKW